jgi:hypothetical protein
MADTADLERRVGAIEDTLGGLADMVRRQPRSTAFPLPRWNWSGLEKDQLRDAWMDLARWVEWMVDAYDLVEWWPWHCWHRHPEVVHQLIPLMHWHLAVHAPEFERVPGSDGPTVDWPSARNAVEWHTMGLRPTLEHIKEALSKCGKEHAERSEVTTGHLAEQRRTALASFGEDQDGGWVPPALSFPTAGEGP